MTNNDSLEQLQNWYLSMCNGDWEHTYGITIGTIDNPGWAMKIDLQETKLKDKLFQTTERQGKDADDWIFCQMKDHTFDGYGGPKNLPEIIAVFVNWANSSTRPID